MGEATEGGIPVLGVVGVFGQPKGFRGGDAGVGCGDVGLEGRDEVLLLGELGRRVLRRVEDVEKTAVFLDG